MTPVAVLLQTCDRPDYTARTLESFLAMNPDRSRFVLLHGDDASTDEINVRLARDAGFTTVLRPTERIGNLAMRIALIQMATKYAPWTLVLENDIESVRPFPWAMFEYVKAHKKWYSLRLFGAFKDAAQQEPCRTIDKWTLQPVEWTPLDDAPEPAEVAQIHWSAQPSVTRTKSLISLHLKGRRKLGLTVRVKQNVMVHIGVERTQPLEMACSA